MAELNAVPDPRAAAAAVDAMRPSAGWRDGAAGDAGGGRLGGGRNGSGPDGTGWNGDGAGGGRRDGTAGPGRRLLRGAGAGPGEPLRALGRQLRSGGRLQDLALAALAVAVIALMVLPMPPAMLDTLIATNIALSVLLLMGSMYARSPLSLSTFPTLLLFTTLLRLSLNIASTRAILLHAHAGDIIRTFGKLVVGGNVIVGVVVFLIIAIVQFIVIAKGAERVAEVGARFTLDALPGKQMSIDAELRAGLIGRDDARARRTMLQRESQLYGAMDGAMKFVKGDAIAGMLIALVNLIAGISIGTVMRGMPLADAVGTYSLLTVGDGLVSQIPSLFVSLAAGVLITRVSSDADEQQPGRSLSAEIVEQLTAHPKALAITSAVLATFLVVPGFPKLQFVAAAAFTGLGAWWLWHGARAGDADADVQTAPALARDGSLVARPTAAGDDGLVDSHAIRLELAPDLAALSASGAIEQQVRAARRDVTMRLGIPFPGLALSISDALAPGRFVLAVNGIPVGGGRVGDGPAGEPHAVAPADAASGDASLRDITSGDDPSAGGSSRTASRVSAPAAANPAGASRDAGADAIGRALRDVLRQHAPAFIGIQETRHLLDEAERTFPDLVAEATRVVPLARLTEVLRRLVEEGVALRNFRDILQALIEWGPREKDVVMLTEFVRNALAAQITYQHGGAGRTLRAVLLAQSVEEEIRAAVQSTPAGNFLSLAPDRADAYAARIAQLTGAAPAADGAALPSPVVIVSMDIRRYVKKMIEPHLPATAVVSYQDLSADAHVRPLGRVEPLA